MHPDTAAPLAQAAIRRHELTRAKAIQALRELDRSGTPVTVAAVASAAGISRSWLYTQPDIRDQIHRLRGARNRSPASAIPAGQRATDASLRARLATALQRDQALADENPGSCASSPTRSAPHAIHRERESRLIANPVTDIAAHRVHTTLTLAPRCTLRRPAIGTDGIPAAVMNDGAGTRETARE